METLSKGIFGLVVIIGLSCVVHAQPVTFDTSSFELVPRDELPRFGTFWIERATGCVDYLMSPAANDLFGLPKAPTAPQPISVSRQEILDLIKADSGGKEFPPDQIAIRPTSASSVMNGGVSVDVGVGVNAPFMPLPKFGFVFDPDGKLACYISGFDTPPHN